MKRTAIALCVLCTLFSQAVLAENLVKNGGFEEVRNGVPVDWTPAMWNTGKGVTFTEVSEEAYAGELSVMVYNASGNDARYEQIVRVKPQTLYRFSCMVRAEGCGADKKGANISVSGIYDTSKDVHDTQGEWEQLEFYGRTGKKQKELTIMARVGGYGNENVGRAWFDEFVVEPVEKLPDDAILVTLETPAPQKERKPLQLGALAIPGLTLLGLLFAALGALFSRAALSGARDLTEQPRVKWLDIVPLLLIALAVRIAVAMIVPGYQVDMNCFGLWAQRLADSGPGKFYADGYFCDYPPGYLFVLWLNGGLMALFGAIPGDGVANLITKLPPVIFDLACVAMLYALAIKKLGKPAALTLAALYAFNPAVLVNGAAWGQVDALMTLGIVLAIYFVIENKWQWALPIYMLCVLIKPQALMFGPLGLVVFIQTLCSKDKAAMRRIPFGLLGMLIVALVVVLPFWGKQPFDWLWRLYGQTLSSYNYASVNAANLFYLMGGNWVEATNTVLGLSWTAWGAIGMALVFAGVIYLTLRAKDRALLYELTALLLFGLFMLGSKMHERYLFPIVLLSMMAFIQRRDWRTLAFIAGVTLTATLNIGLVLAFEHLIAPNVWLGKTLAVINLLALALATWTAVDHCLLDRVRALPAVQQGPAQPPSAGCRAARDLAQAQDSGLHLTWRDWVIMVVITLGYSVLAFWNLGDTKAPQTAWEPASMREQVTFDLGEMRDFQLFYYSGISDDSFYIQTSEDNEAWSLPQIAKLDGGDCFSWQINKLPRLDAEGIQLRDADDNGMFEGDPAQMRARYVRLTPEGLGLTLMEIAFRGADGANYPVVDVSYGEIDADFEAFLAKQGVLGAADDVSALMPLIDEQGVVPERPSYMNSMYFDEIYHGRTAYEHLHNIHTFEWTHPPLGKVLMMFAVQVFGMTPFGWRFAGMLIGILMLPAMYLLAKQLWKRRDIAAFAMLLMTFDCMHYTQTRIATIDSFPVFFIILMYLCMFRYMQSSFYHQKLWKTLVPLALSGLFMGLAIASKWIGIYAGAGLALLFFYALYCRYQEYAYATRAVGEDADELRERTRDFPKYALITLGWCVLWFIVIPALIYYFSFYWELKPDGGLNWQRFWTMQKSMYSYHSQLKATHPFESKWYQWPIIAKPMWYYSTPRLPGGFVSTILSFGNPLIWWGGLVALLWVIGCTIAQGIRMLLDRAQGIARDMSENKRALWCTAVLLIVGFASQYLPWVLVPRSTYIYHYFASVPFIILCIAQCALWLAGDHPKVLRIGCAAFTLVALLLFIGFFPFASGMPMSLNWAEMMQWFPNWMYY